MPNVVFLKISTGVTGKALNVGIALAVFSGRNESANIALGADQVTSNTTNTKVGS